MILPKSVLPKALPNSSINHSELSIVMNGTYADAYPGVQFYHEIVEMELPQLGLYGTGLLHAYKLMKYINYYLKSGLHF